MKEWTSNQIKELRGKHKITQRALGDLLGVTTNYIYLLEKGVKQPSQTLQRLLDCFEEKLQREGR